MIAYITLLLFLIGIFNSFKVSIKFDRILSLMTFLSLAFVFINFCYDEAAVTNGHNFSLLWNSSPGRDIKFEILSTSYNCLLLFPFFALTLFAVLHNINFRYEERRNIYSAIMIFNLIALILIITSNNFVQLLSALFIVDILSALVIKNPMSYRRFIMMNMIADMMLFTVMAIINSHIDSLDIRQIILYKQSGMYVDFLAIIGLTAVLIKMGMFMFHLGIYDLQNIRFHRLQQILFLYSPLAAVILLLKFHILWQASEYFIPYLNLVCILTFAWGFSESLIADSLKAKIICWQAMFWSLLLEMLRFNGFIWSDSFSALYIEMYLLISSVYLTYYQCSRQTSVAQIRLTCSLPYRSKIFSFILIWFSIIAMTNTLNHIYNNSNRYYIWSFAILFIISITHFMRQIYFTANKILPKLKKRPEKIFICAVILSILIFTLRNAAFELPQIWCFALAFLILSRFSPLLPEKYTVLADDLQNISVFETIYTVMIKVIRRFGRFMRLFIDRLFIEKIIYHLGKYFIQTLLRVFRRLHNNFFSGTLFVILLLLLLLWVSFNEGLLT